jgi:hypothetical protein
MLFITTAVKTSNPAGHLKDREDHVVDFSSFLRDWSGWQATMTDLEAHKQSVSMAFVFVGNHLMHINKRSMFMAVSLFGNSGMHKHSLRSTTAVKNRPSTLVVRSI